MSLYDDYVREIKRLQQEEDTFELELNAGALAFLIGCLQVSYRFPPFDADTKASLYELCSSMEAILIARAPELEKAIKQGWDASKAIIMPAGRLSQFDS